MKVLLNIVVVAGLLSIGTCTDLTTTLSPIPTYKLRVCRGVADVVLLLDRSGSVGDRDFPYLISFGLHLARTFQIDPDKVRLGIASYANTARRDINLNTCCYDKFKQITDNMTRGKEDLTNIYVGLLLAEEMLQDKTNGARDGAVKLIIVTNDDRANRGEPPIPTAQRLAMKGINIVSIGIEENVAPPDLNLETRSMASRPDLYYWVPKYTSLGDEGFLRNVTESVCDVVTVREPIVADTTKSIYENTPPGTLIHTIPALIEEFNLPRYELIPQDNLPFRVEADGKIFTTGVLDREVVSQYEFYVHVTDNNFPGFIKKIKVTIIILDINDNAPVPAQLVYDVEVWEDIIFSPPSTILNILATDADEGTNAELRYVLYPVGNEKGKFQLIENSGEFQVKGQLDRETKDFYTLKAYVEDKGTPKKQSVDITINVKVKDRNDNAPKFRNAIVSLQYPENQPLGNLYQVVATDLDLGLNGEVFYKFHPTEGGNEDKKFDLDQVNGYISLIESFDFEQKSQYTLKIVASDKGTPSLSSVATVYITIIDADEPLTIEGPYVVSIPENYGSNSIVVAVTANDPEKKKITYKIVESSPFVIDENGNIKVNGIIDREGPVYVYHLTVQASAGAHSVQTNVTITITDVNDNIPLFGKPNYYGNIDENAVKGTQIKNTDAVTATDQDATSPNNQFMFTIESGNINDAFVIDPVTGIVSVNKPSELDFESSIKTYDLVIKVTDKGSPSLSSTANYQIRINNINDNVPIPKQQSFEAVVDENLPVNEKIVQITTTDADNEKLTYSIPDGLPFAINSETGQIFVSQKLDAETQTLYSFNAIASDGMHSTNIPVKITVNDVNDVVPVFQPAGPLTFAVKEDKERGFVITKLTASDGDLTEPNNVFMMMIEQGNEDNKFTLDPDGSLKLANKLSYKDKKLYTLFVKVTDKGVKPGPLSSVIQIIINVVAVNIHAPEFINIPYSAEIPENKPNPYTFTVSAADADLPNDALTFSITNDVPFNIDAVSGVITGKGIFDSEGQYAYQIHVKVTDKVGHYAEAVVNVLVSDENDEVPHFINGKTEISGVSENIAIGTPLETYIALDKDRTSPNNLVMYMIVGDGNIGDAFKIDTNTGVLSVNKPLDYEARFTYRITIRAQDKGNPLLHSDREVTINLKNENEYPPVFKSVSYTESVSEDKRDGYQVLTVKATDNDANTVITYSLPAGVPFAIDINGNIILKSLSPPDLPLDFEKQQRYDFQVTATDGGGFTATANITIYVLDVNDNAPIFKQDYNVYIPEDFEVGKVVVTVEATDADSGDNKLIMYTIEKGDTDTFSINLDNGEIKLLKRLNFENKNLYELVVKAEDKGNPSLSSTKVVTIHVTDVNEPPTFLTEKDEVTIPEDYQVGREIKIVSAFDPDSGDNGKVTYSIVSGNEDDKYELDMTSGKVTLKNTVNFEVKNKYVLVIRAVDKGNPSLSTNGKDLELTILIQDVNEKPYFDPDSETVTIPETTPIRDSVTKIIAKDPDNGEAGKIMYAIISGNGKDDFNIDSMSGQVSVAQSLDYNRQNKYVLTIRATDKGEPAQNSAPHDFTLTIIVIDVNNNRPVFDPEVYKKEISEKSVPGDDLVRVYATDKDSGLNGEIVYEIIAGNDNDTFKINKITGQISLNKNLKYETKSTYTLIVRAFDKGTPSLYSNPDAIVNVNVTEVNVFAPKITNLPKVVEIEEGKSLIDVYDVEAEDKDGDVIVFSINTDGPFTIDSKTGIVKLTSPLDRESKPGYRIFVTASDGKHEDRSTLDIVVTDINDNKPVFAHKVYEQSISEKTPKDTMVVKVEAFDADEGDNGKVTYAIIAGNDGGKFKIDTNTGIISVADYLDYETTKRYDLIVRASDKGTPMQTSAPEDAKVIINILDENDNKPIFEPSPPINLREDTAYPQIIVTVTATDKDAGDNGVVTYEIVSGNDAGLFKINVNTGEVSLTGQLDYENVKNYMLIIRATDKGSPPKSSAPNDLKQIINVLDVNDNAPQFTKGEYNETIPESTPVGTTVLTVFASDADSGVNKEIEFSIKDGHDGKFKVDKSTGAIILLSELDVTIKKIFVFTVLATDKGVPALVGEALVKVFVTDVNNHRPVFNPEKYNAKFAENVNPGTEVTKVIATDADEGVNAEIMYEIISGNSEKKFQIDMTTGVIRFVDAVDYEKTKVYVLTIRATDKGSPSLHSNPDAIVTITITDENDNKPVYDKTSYVKTIPENIIVGTVILEVTAVDADSGINAEVVYEISTPGVTKFRIDMTNGQISTAGTFDVTVQDKYVFNVKVSDKGTPSQSAESQVTIFISDVNMPPKISPGGPYTIYDNKPIGEEVFTVVAEDPDIGDNGRLTYTLTGGDERFKIDINTGRVTVDKALAAGTMETVELSITATDKGVPPLSDTEKFKVIIKPSNHAPVITPVNTVTIREDTPINTNVVKVEANDLDSGDNGKITFEIVQGNDYTAFNINPSTGQIHVNGVLNYNLKNEYNLVIKVTDKGTPPLSATTTVKILITQTTFPVFTNVPHSSCVTENLPAGVIVFTASATDQDNDILTFFIPDAFKGYPFTIDANTGVLSTTESLDAEKQQNFEIQIGVTDGKHNVLGNVAVCVNNVKDTPPTVIIPNLGTICENAIQGAFVLEIEAESRDVEKGELKYKILASGAVPFAIDNSGKIIVNGYIDFETQSNYKFIVRVSDGDLNTDVNVDINICDLNEYKPVFEPVVYEVKIPDGSESGTTIVTVTATDKDSGTNGIIIYAIIDGNNGNTFTIDKETGKITLNKKVNATEQDMYSLTVSATDRGTNPSSMTSSLNAIVKVIIVRKAVLCECSLSQESYPCIKWTKYEIIRNFEGKCYLDKLKAAIAQIKDNIGSVNRLIAQFTQCKSDLKGELLSPSRSATYEILFMRYDQCLTNVECKLNLWKLQLDQKLAQLQKEKVIEEEGWGTFNLPGADYFEAFWKYMQKNGNK